MNYFKNIIEEEAEKDYYKKLHDFVDNEYKTKCHQCISYLL